MTLVLTTDVGPAQQVLEVSTPAQNTLRPRAQTLDSTLVDNASGVPGATVTAALNSLQGSIVPPGTIVSQIGWDAVGNSNLLVLQPAGHAPGMYEISLVLVVRTVSAGNATANGTWNSPTFGAENRPLGIGMQLNSLGTSVSVIGNTATPLRTSPIMSDGSAAITLQMGGTAIPGLIDIYAMARRVG